MKDLKIHSIGIRHSNSLSYRISYEYSVQVQCSRCPVGLPLTSSLLLEYSSEYLNEYSSTR